jgi:hypothetical protein
MAERAPTPSELREKPHEPPTHLTTPGAAKSSEANHMRI